MNEPTGILRNVFHLFGSKSKIEHFEQDQTPQILKKLKNKDQRPREYLTELEVEALISEAKRYGRNRSRNAAMILLAFRHGLRVSELVNLQWSQINLDEGIINIKRLKGGIDTNHPLSGREIRVLRKLDRENKGSPYVFISEHKSPITDHSFRKLISVLGKRSGFKFPLHPHMLRHATGFKLANDGVDTRTIQHYLGHKDISHTVRYTELSATRFKDLWCNN